MQLAEPLQASWKAHLALQFRKEASRTVCAKNSDGPLVVQKALYPQGPELCHAIVVHPPGGIAGGDELSIEVKSERQSAALLTTPGAGKWYRSGGPWAKQKLRFDVGGDLEWLPRETIVFDGALAGLECEVRLEAGARYIGWEIVCLGRTGSGEHFRKGQVRIDTRVFAADKLLWLERGAIDAGGALMRSPVGLDGKSVFGTLIVAGAELPPSLVNECRQHAVLTALPGLAIGRYLGDSTEEAFQQFRSLWRVLRPAILQRAALEPRIWST